MSNAISTFKSMDARVQPLIVLGALVWVLFMLFTQSKADFLYAYFVVGSTQLISFFINWYALGNNQSKGRKIYAKMLLVTLIMMIPPITFFGLLVLLFAAPAMAVFYCVFTYLETKPRYFFDL